jgi:hypothetical protein
MSATDPNCPDIERLRLAFADEPAGDPELLAHLATCAACRAALESERALLDELTTALAPPPLPVGFEQQIWSRVAGERRSRRTLHILRWSGAVAAAAVLALAWLPFRSAPRPAAGPAPAIYLSAEDAAVLVAGLTTLDWEGSADYVLPSVDNQVSAAWRILESKDSGLPWATSDDWDRPAAERSGERGAQRVGGAPAQA